MQFHQALVTEAIAANRRKLSTTETNKNYFSELESKIKNKKKHLEEVGKSGLIVGVPDVLEQTSTLPISTFSVPWCSGYFRLLF